MTIRVPDTLTSDNSGSYILSIRLRSGGLSFSGYDPSVKGSLFFREVEFDRSSSYVSSLKEFFFTHEFFSWSYKRVNIVCVTPEYTLVPDEFVVEGDERKLLEFTLPVDGKRCLVDSIGRLGSKLIYAIDEEVYEFCSRSLTHPFFSHYITSLLSIWMRYPSRVANKRLYAVVEKKRLDLLSVYGDGVVLANSYTIGQSEDLIYYILYVWKELALDPERDDLYILSDSATRMLLLERLRQYLRSIRQVEMPSEAFLLGVEAAKAPMDLISLLLCE